MYVLMRCHCHCFLLALASMLASDTAYSTVGISLPPLNDSYVDTHAMSATMESKMVRQQLEKAVNVDYWQLESRVASSSQGERRFSYHVVLSACPSDAQNYEFSILIKLFLAIVQLKSNSDDPTFPYIVRASNPNVIQSVSHRDASITY
jgi:hypothetical protein